MTRREIASNESLSPAASTLQQIVSTVYRRRLLLLLATLASAVVAAIASFLVTPVYRAEVTFMPADSASGSETLNVLMSQFGGLAGLAGIAPQQSDHTAEGIALLTSRQLTERFISENSLMPRLYSKKWDLHASAWLPSIKKPPTMGDAFKLFDRDIRTVTQQKRTGVITLDIDWVDREEAAHWANQLIRLVNSNMRDRAILEAEKSIQYLNQELAKTEVVALRDAIYRMIEANIKQRTLANVREEYAFKVLDPAVVPEISERLSPRPAVYVLFGVVLGFVLSVAGILAVDSYRSALGWIRAE